jgi:arabinose-5-phosphate isomerase
VRDIMHESVEVPLVAPDAPMSEALLVMTAKSFGCVGVREPDGRLIGVITDGDLRRHMEDSLLRQRARAIMSQNPKTIAPMALAVDALGLMNRTAITSLFVVDEVGRPIGFLHMHDCLRAGVA